MAVTTDSFCLDLIILLIPIVYFIYWFVNNNNDYWDNRGVPNIKGGLVVGSLTGKESQAEGISRIYKHFLEEKFGGFFQLKTPVLMVRDLDLIHRFMVKDFSSFYDRPSPTSKKDPLSSNLFNLRGQAWRELRYKLTPTFTTGKLKGMFEQVTTSGDNLVKDVDELVRDHPQLEIKNVIFDFTLDVIASCAFGLQFKQNTTELNHFKTNVKRIFEPSPFVFMKYVMLFMFPKLSNILDIRPFPKDIADFSSNLTKSTIQFRKENNLKRNDYFQLLIALKEQEESGHVSSPLVPETSEDDAIINQMSYAETKIQSQGSTGIMMTDDVISANSFIFLTGGTESTSATITFTLLELSRHEDVQLKLQQEVDSVLAKHGGWSYAAVKDMTYLDQVIQETLRLYPVFPHIFRECVERYRIPGSEVVIEKGVLICIPVCALQRDTKYYPEPDTFKPERFQDNNFKPNSAYLPFGDGPRICIAMRFAVMEIKTCVAKIISQFKIKLGSNTKLPLEFNKKAFIPKVEGGIWMQFYQRDQNK